jgi:hypothetical protein
MIDIFANVTIVTPSSTFESLPAVVLDPDLADLDRPAASLDHLMSYRYEPGANQAASIRTVKP